MKIALRLFFSLISLLMICKVFAAPAIPSLPVNTVPLRFVITANNGSIVPGDQPNQFVLTLNNVNPYATYYPRRPSREFGLASVQNFIKAWNVGPDNFANDNPNAVLYAGYMNQQENSSNISYVMQLSNPSYSSANNTLSFNVVLLGNQQLLFQELLMRQVILVVN